MNSITRNFKKIGAGFVYILTDPRNNEPFYVGFTMNPMHRYKLHIYARKSLSSEFKKHTPTKKRICEICDAGFMPIMEIVDFDKGSVGGRYLEDRWIKALIARGFKLTNIVKRKERR